MEKQYNTDPSSFNPSSYQSHAPLVRASTQQATLSTELLSFTYDQLLNFCSSRDKRNIADLVALGFDERTIKKANYRTTPTEIGRLITEVEMNSPTRCGAIFKNAVAENLSVPGFFFDGNRMRLNMPREGQLIVSVKDTQSQIIALQIYRDAQDEQPRWFDSNGLPRGAKAIRRPHFARPYLARESGGIVIAEHTLAADLHAWKNDEAAVAINDILPSVFARSLRESLLDVSFVAFAFASPDTELLRALHSEGFEVCSDANGEVH
jgi:hypothetical protein